MPRIPLLAFLALIFPAALLAAIPIADPHYIAMSGGDSAPAIAANGATAMAVWARPGISASTFLAADVVARPIGSDGKPLLTAAIPLLPVGVTPAIGCGEAGCLVVGGTKGGTNGVRISRDGEVLDATPFVVHPITNVDPFGRAPSVTGGRHVAWDGERYVVVSTTEYVLFDPNAHAGLIASTVDVDGHVTQQEIRVAEGGWTGVVAARNGVAVIAWWANGFLFTRSLQGAGALGAVTVVAAVPAKPSFDIAATPGGFTLVWNDGAVKAALLDPSGAPTGTVLTLSDLATGAVAIAGTPRGFTAAWSDGKQVFATNVDGTHVDPAVVLKSTQVPALAAGDDSVVALSIDSSNRTVVEKVGADDEPAPVDIAIAMQDSPKVVFDGTNYIAAWTERIGDVSWNARSLVVGRFPPSGKHLDGSGIVVAAGSMTPYVSMSTVVSFTRGARTHLLLWRTWSNEVRAALIGSDGSITPVSLPQSFYGTGAVWNGSSFLVLGYASMTSPATATYAVRVAPDGQLLDSTPLHLLDYVTSEGIFAGDRYFFATSYIGTLLVFTVDDQLRPLNVSSVDTPPVARPMASYDLASDGVNCLVVASTGPSSGAVGQLFDHAGNRLGAEIAFAPQASAIVGTAWDGAAWTTMWWAAGPIFGVSRISHDARSASEVMSIAVASGTTGPAFAPGAIVYGQLVSNDDYKRATLLMFDRIVLRVRAASK